MNQTMQRQTTTAPTELVRAGDHAYACRRFGRETGVPLLCLQHFTGTLDNWDPALTDELALTRPVILFDNAGIGKSSGEVPGTVAGMAEHAMRFLDALGLQQVDVLGFSLGGMVAQVIALERPTLLRRIVLAGTGPKSGPGTAMDRPELIAIFVDRNMSMPDKLLKLFFPQNAVAQEAAHAFVARLAERSDDRDTETTGQAAGAQLTAMAHWQAHGSEALTELKRITHPVLVTNGNNDIMIPTTNSLLLFENLPDAQLILYPNSGHGALFQYAPTFASHVREFLDRVAPGGTSQ